LTQGLPALNEAILDMAERRCGVRPESSMVTAGVAGGLALTMLTLLEPGERALIPDPYFVCYDHMLSMIAGGSAVYDLYPDFRVTEECLEDGMREDVRFILVNSPSNPTGRALEEDELKIIASFARRHDLPVVSDEIYDLFSYDGKCPSMLTYYDQTILLGGFSKSFGVPGWRLGYALGDAEVIDKMRTLQQFSFVCAPAPLQHGALAAMRVDMTEKVDLYRRKRDIIWNHLGEAYDLVRPTGAFYAFPKAPGGLTGTAFADRLLEKEILVVPGGAFSRADTHFRLSFALPEEKLIRGCDLLVALARDVEAEMGVGG
jgi:aspartate aminotransferase/aminotransferase